jgi:hypothetical protein
VRRGLRRRDDGSNVTNVQYKSNQNCNYETTQYNECILIKIYFKRKSKITREKWTGGMAQAVECLLRVQSPEFKP